MWLGYNGSVQPQTKLDCTHRYKNSPERAWLRPDSTVAVTEQLLTENPNIKNLNQAGDRSYDKGWHQLHKPWAEPRAEPRSDADLLPYLQFSSHSVSRSGPLATLQVGTLVKHGDTCYTHPELGCYSSAVLLIVSKILTCLCSAHLLLKIVERISPHWRPSTEPASVPSVNDNSCHAIVIPMQ